MLKKIITSPITIYITCTSSMVAFVYHYNKNEEIKKNKNSKRRI